MESQAEMLKNKAIRVAAVAACVTLFSGAVDSAVAAPKKAVMVDPFAVIEVSVAPLVVVVAPPVFVPVVPAVMTPGGNAPTKGPPITASPGAPPPAQFTGGGSPVPPPAPVF
ncbi:MAG: hypothetical protein JWM57_764 [Phycisphaerales bacterium]|nr:hypothetical protein [Phycisphaerales bacterium]